MSCAIKPIALGVSRRGSEILALWVDPERVDAPLHPDGLLDLLARA